MISGSFFELVQTRHYNEGEISLLPEHTDMHRLSIDMEGGKRAKISIQLSSTYRPKSALSYIYLTEQELIRLLGALVEKLFNFSGIQPEIRKSMYSNHFNQLDIFTPGKAG